MGKKSKKAKKDKIPKKVAGVKVPKELRNAGGMLFKIARDPHAREVALAAVTAALAARKDTRTAARKAVAETGEATAQAGKFTSLIGPALTAAAMEAGRLLLDAYENGSKTAASQSDPSGGEAEGKASKRVTLKEEAPSGATH